MISCWWEIFPHQWVSVLSKNKFLVILFTHRYNFFVSVAFHNAIPFIGFGFLDNAIMIIAVSTMHQIWDIINALMVWFLFFGGLQEGSLIPFHQQILEKFMGHIFLEILRSWAEVYIDCYVWGVAKISFLTREGAVSHNYLIILPSFIYF